MNILKLGLVGKWLRLYVQLVYGEAHISKLFYIYFNCSSSHKAWWDHYCVLCISSIYILDNWNKILYVAHLAMKLCNNNHLIVHVFTINIIHIYLIYIKKKIKKLIMEDININLIFFIFYLFFILTTNLLQKESQLIVEISTNLNHIKKTIK